LVLNNGNIKILSFYNSIDIQCVKIRILYSVIALDQKSSGSSLGRAIKKAVQSGFFVAMEGRDRSGAEIPR
jgi:hypothetical protein